MTAMIWLPWPLCRRHRGAICIGADGAHLANHRKIQLYRPAEARRFIPRGHDAVFTLAGGKAAMRPFDRVDAHIAPATTNHAVTTVYANLSNAEGALEYFGGAVIAGAGGKVLARGGTRRCMLIATTRPDDARLLSTQGQDLRRLIVGS